MAKLIRVPAKVFAASAAADEIGQFGSAVAGSKLETADVATIQGLSAWLNGWSEALVSGNRYPALQEMNGLLKVLSYQGAYALQEGIPEYDASTTYYIGSIVKKTGTFELYGSLTNDNVGNALVDGANWKLLVDLNNVSTSAIIPLGSCATASATTEKAVTLSGFVLTTGATIQVTFANANTAATPTLNVNSTGAKAIYNESGTAVSATNPAYFPAGSTVEFTYNGTNWIFKKRVVENYVNGSSWYRVYSDGWIEQGGFVISDTTVTLLKPFINISYSAFSTIFSTGNSGGYTWIANITTSALMVKGNIASLPMCWFARGY